MQTLLWIRKHMSLRANAFFQLELADEWQDQTIFHFVLEKELSTDAPALAARPQSTTATKTRLSAQIGPRDAKLQAEEIISLHLKTIAQSVSDLKIIEHLSWPYQNGESPGVIYSYPIPNTNSQVWQAVFITECNIITYTADFLHHKEAINVFKDVHRRYTSKDDSSNS